VSVTIDGNSLASIIAAAGGATAAVITALNRRTARVSEAKVDDQAAKVEEVHTLVNSTLTDAVERRDASEAENVELRQQAKDAGR
jgi:sporulation-control protein spo0M